MKKKDDRLQEFTGSQDELYQVSDIAWDLVGNEFIADEANFHILLESDNTLLPITTASILFQAWQQIFLHRRKGHPFS